MERPHKARVLAYGRRTSKPRWLFPITICGVIASAASLGHFEYDGSCIEQLLNFIQPALEFPVTLMQRVMSRFWQDMPRFSAIAVLLIFCLLCDFTAMSIWRKF